MRAIYADLDLDFDENRSLKSIKVKQFEDRGRTIRLFLYKGGQPVIFSGLETAKINASVNQTVTTYNKECIINSTDSYIEIPLYPSLTTLAGTERCEVKFENPQGETIYTATFSLDVEPSVATTEYAEVLKTTELAAVLQDHEIRIETLEKRSGNIKTAGEAVKPE